MQLIVAYRSVDPFKSADRSVDPFELRNKSWLWLRDFCF